MKLIRSWKVLMLFLAAVCAFAPGALMIKIETDASIALLPEGGQEAIDYQEYRSKFPSDFGSKILIEDNSKVGSQAWWENLISLHEDLEALDQVYRVESLVSARHTKPIVFADGEVGIEMGDLISHSTVLDEALFDYALSYPPYRDVFISQTSDGTCRVVFNVIARGANHEAKGTEGFDAVIFDQKVSEVVESHSGDFANIYHVGEPRVSAAISEAILRSTTFIGLVLLMMVLIVWFDTGYLVLGFLAALTGGTGLFFAWSVMGYAGVARNPINDLVVQMLIPIGGAFVIHAYSYAKQYAGVSYKLKKVSALAFKSFAFATLTTLIGYGATGISPYPAIREFGIFGVIGILGCLLTTFTLVFPVLLHLGLPEGRSRIVQMLERYFGFAPDVAWVLGKKQTILALIFVAVFIAIGLCGVDVNYVPANYISERNQIRAEFEYVRQDDSVYSMVYTVAGLPPQDGSEFGDIIEPLVMTKVDEFNKHLEEVIPGLRAVSIWEQLSQIWVDGDTPPATTRRGVAQELFVSFSDYDDRELYLTEDTLAVLLQVPFKGSQDFRQLEQEVDNFEQELGRLVTLTGRVPGYFRAGDHIALDNLLSLVIGALVIYLVFLIFLRNAKVAAIGLLVNIIPVFIILSLMGWLGFYLDLGASIVSTIALCLVVDDTGHFLSAYSSYRKIKYDADVSVALTLKNRGGAIFSTTIVIVLGLSVLVFAPLIPFHTFAILLGLTMLFALFGDLVILPSLLVHFDK